MSESKHAAKWAIQPGELYVYRDEDGDAIAIAKACVGPNGGFVGADIAKIAIPRKYTTQAELNALALQFTAAPALLSALKTLAANSGEILADFPEIADEVNAAIAKAEGR